MILLKKRGTTVATYSKGSYISFETTTGAHTFGDITEIRNDTIFLQQFIIRQVPTTFGVYVVDTLGSYRYQYHYNEIKSIDKTGRRFDLSASGASLLGGGIIIVAGSGIVYLADRDKFSPALAIAGAVLGTAGYFMMKHNSNIMNIGKKYKLTYLDISSNKIQ
ncbi:MAG: hypothetical protein HY305_00780 [Sphingobacteriales bacterium]|nr:hypothetical protein [Sphingobacteriales bacterium]